MPKIFYDIIPPKEFERMKRDRGVVRIKSFDKPRPRFDIWRNFFLKITVILLIVGLNWTGLSAVYQTIAYMSDTENSPQNVFSANNLDFSIPPTPDFSPSVTPTATSSRNISIINDGILGFQYTVTTTNATGTLCDYLNLTANLDGNNVYTGSSIAFNYNAGEFSTSTDDWQFTATLTSDDPALQNQTCNFDFVFDGVQIGGAGFSDQEIIPNTITSGMWLKVVINKVYYDVDANHGTEPKNEWIELYNPTNQDINIKNWVICDNNNCKTINPDVSIPDLGYVLLSHDNSTWQYWEVPAGVEKINLGGAPSDLALDNDADMLVLKNASSNIIDQINWGTPTTTWPNYNDNLWNPGVTPSGDGWMAARVPTGVDTDTDKASDWHNLGLPQVHVVWPNVWEVLYVGDTYTIQWSATNTNGMDTDLTIDIYYSKNSGNTWAKITSTSTTENDGTFEWRIPLFIDSYYVPSHHARIKVMAYGPENFMVQAWDMSDHDFCPPIDYSLLTDEEKAQVEGLLVEGILTEADIINRGITNLGEAPGDLELEEGENTTFTEEATTTIEEIATTTEATTIDVTTSTETISENAETTEDVIEKVLEEITDETTTDEVPADEVPADEALTAEEQPATVPDENFSNQGEIGEISE